jgi:hypothetical protein
MSRGRGPLGWRSFIVFFALIIFFMYAGLTPWALHIGGQSTPGEQWYGFGEVHASNGGRYVLYTYLQGGLLAGSGFSRRGGALPHSHADNLHGTAELCGTSGVTYTFKLTGVVDSWWSTDDAPTGIDLARGTPVRLPFVVPLRGRWHGPALELSAPDNSFTQAFTPSGEIRHVTSTADAGTARVTLQYGSHDAFATACQAIRHR